MRPGVWNEATSMDRLNTQRGQHCRVCSRILVLYVHLNRLAFRLPCCLRQRRAEPKVVQKLCNS